MKLNQVKNEIMEMVKSRDEEDCLDMAERIQELIVFDLQCSAIKENFDCMDCLDYIDNNILPNLEILINKLRKEHDDKRSKDTD